MNINTKDQTISSLKSKNDNYTIKSEIPENNLINYPFPMNHINHNLESNNITFETPTLGNNDLCTRFIRKKFQCIMVFLATLYLFLEVFKISLEKLDKETLTNFMKNQTVLQ